MEQLVAWVPWVSRKAPFHLPSSWGCPLPISNDPTHLTSASGISSPTLTSKLPISLSHLERSLWSIGPTLTSQRPAYFEAGWLAALTPCATFWSLCPMNAPFSHVHLGISMGMLFCAPQLLSYAEMHGLSFMISSQINGARLLRVNPSSDITSCASYTLANLCFSVFSSVQWR